MSCADDVAVVPPAPGDIFATHIERAAAEFGGHRALTLVGGFGLAALREAAAAQEDDHLPFPLVRRREAR